jgi:hypothetical protein
MEVNRENSFGATIDKAKTVFPNQLMVSRIRPQSTENKRE